MRVGDAPAPEDELRILHKLLKKVRSDMEALAFNTAVSAFMIATTAFGKLERPLARETLSALARALAPMLASVPLRFELTPKPEYAVGAGSVEYLEVPAASFERVSKGCLECKDIECLNDGKARYMLIDEYLVLTRKTEGDPNVSAGETSFHVITLDATMLDL